MIGIIGEIAILAAFVACLATGFAYVRAHLQEGTRAGDAWKRIGRGSWLAMCGTVAVASGILFALLITSRFEYAYVYQQSALSLPLHYKISAFWAGQEGSFLLWIIMVSAVGASVLVWARRRKGIGAASIKSREFFEAPVMFVVALCQAFMLSMLLGLQLGPITIGASPFLTLAERFPDAPFILAGGVPADGNGLNDLLQNPWMTIHPPTLFLGFTLLLVPFAFAVAGLWTRRYTEWVRPALPWALIANGILLLGIVMGGYWAYITLSFGGYWAWDPVENSSLVPWLFGVAAAHSMIVQKRSAAGHKAALLLSVTAFIFVIYSTFLTRSGVLGEVSVHSFVDLGLYNQLLVWILAIAALGFGLFAWRYRELPTPKNPPASLSRETMIFTGALLLCLLGLVIILGTSAPIIGRLFRDNPAAVPIAFYNTWTLPLAVGIAFLAGLGQLFWWRKMTPENVNRQLMKPLMLTVASTAAVLFFTPFVDVTVDAPMLPAGAGPAMAVTPEATQAALLPPALSVFWEHYGMSLMLLLLLFGSFFALYGNGAVLLKVARGNLKMAGGAITHIGFALMLLGIFASSVFNDPITDGRGASVGGDRDNFVLTPGERRVVDGFIVSYESEHVNDRGHMEYAVEFMDPRGRSFTATMAVFRDNRGQVIQHPHVQKYIGGDVYVAAFPSWMTRDENDPTDATDVVIQRGDSLAVGPYNVHFRDYALDVDFETVGLDPATTQLAVGAVLDVTHSDTGVTRTLRPVYAIDREDHAQFIQTRAIDWDLTVTFTSMQVDRDAIRLVFEGPGIAPPEWLLVQAYQKPMISLLWLGTIIVIFGFGIAFYRRATEARVAGGSGSQETES